MKVHDEYWDEFIPAMLPTRLGSATDGDPQLAAAWLGWQERRKIDDDRLRELEAALRETELRLRMYGGHTANCAYHLSHYKGPVSQCDCMWTDLVPTVFATQGDVAK